MKLHMGGHELEIHGPYMTELRASNDILGDVEALRKRMHEDGYLLIRGFHDRADVLAARGAVLAELDRQGQLDRVHPLTDGVIAPGRKGGMLSRTLVASSRELLDVVNGPRVMGFFERFLGGTPLTFDYKWLRAVPSGSSSGIHYDTVYVGRGTANRYTVWTPLGDLSYDHGTLAICLGSHRFEKLKDTYGRVDIDRDRVDGTFSRDPVEIVEKFGGKWATTEFRAGDALIFGLLTLHGSTTNTTNQFRLSCDTRYQLASDPVDDRWMGPDPKAHDATARSAVADLRPKWGI